MEQIIATLNRRFIFSILLALFLLPSCTQRSRYQDSYIIEVDGKKGLIDSVGNVIVEPRFVEITPILRNGFATVIIDTLMKRRCDSTIFGVKTYDVIQVKYGYINSSNKFLFKEPSFSEIKIQPDFDVAHLLFDFCINHSFSNGLAVVENKSFLCGYRNLKGDTIIPCIYSNAKVFSENRAVVQKPFSMDSIKNRSNRNSYKYGFIDKNGKEVSQFNFVSLTTLRRNRSIGVIGYESYDGYEIDGELKKNADGSVSIDYSKRSKVENDGVPEIGISSFLIDENGNIVSRLDMSYSYSNFSDDDIAIAVPNFWSELMGGAGFGFIDKNGKILKPLDGFSEEQFDSLRQYDYVRGVLPQDITILDATRFTDGFAGVKLFNELWVFVDKHLVVYGKKGEEAFQDAGPFSHGLAAVKRDGKWGYIDNKFNILIPCQYDSCCPAGRNLSKIYQYYNNIKTTSYIDRTNKIVWQNTEYNQISTKRDDNSKQKSDWGKWNMVDYEQESAFSYSWIIILAITVFIILLSFLYKTKTLKYKTRIKISTSHHHDEDSIKINSNQTIPPSNSMTQTLSKFDIVTDSNSCHSLVSDISLQNRFQSPDPNNNSWISSSINNEHQVERYPENRTVQTAYSTPKIHQEEGYYCYSLFPNINSTVFPYRKGRLEKRGYTEASFEEKLIAGLIDFYNYEVLSNISILPVDNAHPYEPDICIIEKSNRFGIRIDIEIDEPYTGYEQKSIHFIGCGDEYRDANILNLGWIVIRFSEKQVYTEAEQCVGYIKYILSLLDNTLPHCNFITPQKDKKWTSIEAAKMATKGYRENYLHHHFSKFNKPETIKLKIIDNKQTELEKEIAKHIQPIPLPQNKVLNIDNSATVYSLDNRLRFEPKEHIYILDGVLQLMAVSEVIAKFFNSFDIIKQSEQYAHKNGMCQIETIEKWDAKGSESRDVGTFLHEQIEKYLKGQNPSFEFLFEYNGEIVNYQKTISIKQEFSYFIDFLRESEINPFRSEWRIFDEKYKIAGTIDLICRNGSQFDIYDWKRSAKASPNENVWQYGKNGLENVKDISFYKYALQQNLYKYILENNYGVKINKMNLIVLHPKYDTYVKYEIPKMDKEISIILDSLIN